MTRILAAAAPAYLPDRSCFAKMVRADCFVLADDLLFSKKGRVNRTQIKTAGGTRWMTVPVLTRAQGRQLIRDVQIDPTRHWAKKHWKTLQVNYQYAPYFEFYADAIAEIYHREWCFLLDLNRALLAVLRKALGIAVPETLSSAIPARPGVSASERIVQIARETGCDTYLAAAADRAFLDENIFAAAGIRLAFPDYAPKPYRQLFGPFVANLSVMDLLFNLGGSAAYDYL